MILNWYRVPDENAINSAQRGAIYSNVLAGFTIHVHKKACYFIDAENAYIVQRLNMIKL